MVRTKIKPDIASIFPKIPEVSVNVKQWNIDPPIRFVQLFHGQVTNEAGTQEEKSVHTQIGICYGLKPTVGLCQIVKMQNVGNLECASKLSEPVSQHDPRD